MNTFRNNRLSSQQLWEIKMGISEKQSVPKPKKPINKESKKKKAATKKKREQRNGENTELQKWYQNIMEKEDAVCWETGQEIKKYCLVENEHGELKKVFDAGWHGSIAHILPKKLFPSVATHPKNYIILKMWGGTHGQYDSSWLNASKMGIWKYCIDVIKNDLFPILTKKEISKLPEVIIKYLN